MKRIIKTNIFIAVMAIMLSVGTYFAEDPPEDYNPQQKSTIAAIYTDEGETAAYTIAYIAMKMLQMIVLN